MSEALVLEGVFRELCRQGMALSVRDYLDALSALANGFGWGSKEALIKLCQALWARSRDEDRLVRLAIEQAVRVNDWERPYVESGLVALRGEAPEAADAAKAGGPSEAPRDEPTRLRLQFEPSGEGGLPLPRANVRDRAGDFILTERSPVAERAMAVAWRRFHRPARSGAPSELDIEATAQAQALSRVLSEPVLVPARSNRARVVLAIDVSDSMVAWERFSLALERALAQGRLARSTVLYFDNVPDQLFRQRTLEAPRSLAEELRANEGSALLVVSDAGAARGNRRAQRQRATRAFVKAVAGRWQPIVWLNPLPLARWRGSTAELIAALPGIASFPLDPLQFTRAMDALRGRA